MQNERPNALHRGRSTISQNRRRKNGPVLKGGPKRGKNKPPASANLWGRKTGASRVILSFDRSA